MRSLLRFLVTLSLLLCAVDGSRVAFAQPKPDKKAEAKARFQQGDAHLQAGAYQAAIDEFKKAYELFPSDRIHFNIAQAYRLKGDRDKALEHYLKYLNAVAGGDTADEARRHVAALRRAIAEEAELEKAKQEKAAAEQQAAEARAAEEKRKQAELGQQREESEVKRRRQRLILIGAVAGGVVVLGIALGVGLGIGLRSDGIPSSTLGTPPVPVSYGLRF